MKSSLNNRWRCVAAVVTIFHLSLLSTQNGTAQPAQQFTVQTQEMLASDKQLQEKVSLQETGISLAELLRRVSPKNFSLTAAQSCSNLKIQVRLRQHPLYVLMHSLAQLVPGYWITHKDGKGLELVMKREAVLSREKWWHLFESDREQAKIAQRADLLRQMRAKPRIRKPNDPNPENSDLAIEAQMSERRSFFHELPSELQEQIANMATDCPLFSTGRGSFGTGNEENALQVKLSSLPSGVQQRAKKAAAQILANGKATFDADNAWVSFTNGGFCVLANIITSDGKETGTAASLSGDIAPRASTLFLNHKNLPWMLKELGKTAPDTLKRLAAYEEIRVWKNALPTQRERIHKYYNKTDTLDWLAEKVGIDFVSDYYMNNEYPMPDKIRNSSPVIPLEEELNFQADGLDMSWKKRSDGIYLFRNNRWYRDDALEIPLPLLQRLYLRKLDINHLIVKGKLAVPETEYRKKLMDLDAEVIQSLNLYQIAQSLRGFNPEVLPEAVQKQLPSPTEEDLTTFTKWGNYPFRDDTQRIIGQLNTIRFYASLDDEARKALIAGKLPYSQLNETQRKLAVFLQPLLRPVVSKSDASSLILKLMPRPNFTSTSGLVRLSFVETAP